MKSTKKIIAILVLLVVVTSCQKKYSCKCTTTITAQYYYPYKTESVVEIPKNSTKRKAKQMCDNAAQQVLANAKLLIGDDYGVGTECELKDY